MKIIHYFHIFASVSGGGCAKGPLPGLCPWTPMRDFCIHAFAVSKKALHTVILSAGVKWAYYECIAVGWIWRKEPAALADWLIGTSAVGSRFFVPPCTCAEYAMFGWPVRSSRFMAPIISFVAKMQIRSVSGRRSEWRKCQMWRKIRRGHVRSGDTRQSQHLRWFFFRFSFFLLFCSSVCRLS